MPDVKSTAGVALRRESLFVDNEACKLWRESTPGFEMQYRRHQNPNSDVRDTATPRKKFKRSMPSCRCLCSAGFGGVLCETNYDDCLPEPVCANRATCLDGINSFTCVCPEGTTGKEKKPCHQLVLKGHLH